jgi:Icc-related predicted phosphoesterase
LIIDCISDLHGHYPELEGGDLLIVAGDLTRTDDYQEWKGFFTWVKSLCYKKKIVICGNHDRYMEYNPGFMQERFDEFTYLCDSGTEFEGLKIWGSPWTKRFEGMNPNCMAFTVDTEEELAQKWAMIPENIDILVTHSPSEGVLDEINEVTKWGTKHFNVGSSSLVIPMIKSGCKLHVFGHIHESYGKFYNAINGITYINASHVNEKYEPVNKPIRVIL